MARADSFFSGAGAGTGAGASEGAVVPSCACGSDFPPKFS